MVRILFTPQPSNRRWNSRPISSNRAISIWWFRKLSTLSTSVPRTTPSFRIRSFSSSTTTTAFPDLAFPKTTVARKLGPQNVDGNTQLFYKKFIPPAIPFSNFPSPTISLSVFCLFQQNSPWAQPLSRGIKVSRLPPFDLLFSILW